ncbi:hypothetical protein F5880DRAFT_1729251 [Lentinula raphanica]|nr:hypothetical protein F5880DRAFT_1729251 [Lentinula raphanica]
MDPEYHCQVTPQESGPQPHPYLHKPLLYISNLPSTVSDESLGMAFMTCAPFRPKITRDNNGPMLSGTIEFKFLEKGAHPMLSPYPPTNPPTPLPPPFALPRLVKHLPINFGDSALFHLCRPFGALASVRIPTHFGVNTGMIECINHERRLLGLNDFNANAPTFVPLASVFGYSSPATYSPPRLHYSLRSPVSPIPHIVPQFVHGPGQQVQLAPLSGPGSNSHSGLIGPCNLFCKNLDPDIDLNALFSHFRQFGQIVSACVMRNEAGESRGFGSVSYQAPDQAAAAMHAMNGITLDSKQEKLAIQFASGGNGHPRTASGATSPTASEGGDSYGAGRRSPESKKSDSESRELKNLAQCSFAFTQAALAGTLNLPMRYDDLAALTPVVRKEVLARELNKCVKSLGNVASADVDSIVDSFINTSLGEIIQAIEDPEKLASEVDQIKTAASLSTPPHTSSPSRSVAPTSERDRIAAAVGKFENSPSEIQAQPTELLMSLPK